ncbi:MAG: bifunctional DNA-formamidopyrimidine glycosylase/DNA-(apurinic or apyrimidinic site) lyase [Candidatus Niyogibacteria bacterium]|nr:bifunctional DNA-formamidopyrimidine glycosylase/DNA-(apurinic or apyrimidinic site) lyase [Candidatus Niyogibacteria bacterium]
MPELPEVETIKRGLTRVVLGRRIAAVDVLELRSVLPSAAFFRRELIGRKIKTIDRRGKYLIFTLDNGRIMIGHLRMTGQLIVAKNPAPQKFSRVVIEFSGGISLHFNDLRKFGRLELLPKKYSGPLLANVGEDMLTIAPHAFHTALARRPRANIKAALLDQRFFSGIGNIYADEALYAAGILPERAVGDLSLAEMKKLYLVTKRILARAVRLGGTSYSDYVDAAGQPGRYLKELKVYQRHGKPCKKCRALIRKRRLAGRGTHYCEKCQL